jgi:hypothetical protein
VLDAEDDPELRSRVVDPGDRAHVERVVVLTLEAFDFARSTSRRATPALEIEALGGPTGPRQDPVRGP